MIRHLHEERKVGQLMRRLFVGMILSALLLPAGIVEAAPKDTFALLVGVSTYADGQQAGSADCKGIANLTSSSADAASMAQLLKGGGVPEKNIKQLCDRAATAGAIRSGLDWLDAHAGKAETLIFYFSGHGSSDVPDLDGDESVRSPGDQADEALLPYDVRDFSQRTQSEIAASPALRQSFFEHLITDDELYRRCAGWKCRVIIIVDCCFSGGVLMHSPSAEDTVPVLLCKTGRILRPADGILMLKGCRAPLKSSPGGRVMELPDNVAFLAACQEDQTAIDDTTLKAGWFTYGLRSAVSGEAAMQRADANADHAVSLAEAFGDAVLTIGELKEQRRNLPLLLQIAGGVPAQEPLALNLWLADSIVLGTY